MMTETPETEQDKTTPKVIPGAPSLPYAALDTSPPRRLSLRTNFAWTTAGNLVYAVSQWGVTVVLAKLGSAALLGEYGLAVAVCIPIVAFFQFHLRSLLVTDARNEFAFGHYLALTLIMMPIALIVCGIAGWSLDQTALTLLVAINLVLYACHEIFFGIMQKAERMNDVSIGQMLLGVLNIAVLWAVLASTDNLLLALAAAALARVMMLFTYNGPIVRRMLASSASLDKTFASIRPIWSPTALWRLARLGLPLGIVMTIITAEAAIPRIAIDWFGTAEMLGYFFALVQLQQVGMLLIGALGQSAAPRLGLYYATNAGAFRTLTIKLCVLGGSIGAAGVAVAWVLGSTILRLLYAPEYADFNRELVVVMIAGMMLFVCSFLGYALTAARYVKVQVPINLVVLVTIVAGSAVFIPRYALQGAAMSLVLAAFVRLLLQSACVVRAIRSSKGPTN